MSECVSVHRAHARSLKSPENGASSPATPITAAMWVLGMEPGASETAASALSL